MTKQRQVAGLYSYKTTLVSKRQIKQITDFILDIFPSFATQSIALSNLQTNCIYFSASLTELKLFHDIEEVNTCLNHWFAKGCWFYIISVWTCVISVRKVFWH